MTAAHDPARRAALEALTRVEEDDAYSTHVVPTAVVALTDERDRRFASHLAYDTLRWRGTLDWLLEQVLTRPLDQVEDPLQRVLRMGALQLWRMRVPDRAAVGTSVDLARTVVPRQRAEGAARFVNGVLRNLARRLPDLPWPADDRVAALALTTGHPRWIVEERLAHHDEADVAALLDADNQPPGLTLRAVGDRDALLAELAASGLEVDPTPLAELGIRVPGADPRSIPAVQEGRAVPQDEASMLVSATTTVGVGDTVVDLCAGPGGKTTHLASLVGPTGRVVAVELHPHRARMVQELAARMGLDIETVVGDARSVGLDADVDAVLVDAPCTGLGVGRRRPEVRWRRKPGDAEELASLQTDLVRHAVEMVRAGGSVTYAVCTWTAAETTEVVDTIEASSTRQLLRTAMRQYLPSTDGTDGMFVARWLVDPATRPD